MKKNKYCKKKKQKEKKKRKSDHQFSLCYLSVSVQNTRSLNYHNQMIFTFIV